MLLKHLVELRVGEWKTQLYQRMLSVHGGSRTVTNEEYLHNQLVQHMVIQLLLGYCLVVTEYVT